MDRRKFLIGLGASSVGGSALIGTGAFSRIDAQRNVTIQVAPDPDAYLGLDGCGTPNSSFTDIDENGHLQIRLTSENETDEGGLGVNSDSRSWFDRVFQVCNQGKQAVAVYIEDEDGWPYVSDDEVERRVDFYYEDQRERSIVGRENAELVQVGDCICIGLRTTTHDLGVDDVESLLEDLDDTVTVTADVNEPVESGPVWNETQGTTFTTISGALDEAVEGDVIKVFAEGNPYEEQVVIPDSDITLMGIGNPVIQGDSDTDRGVDIRGHSDVTVAGFTIRDFNRIINMRGSRNVIADNTIEGITDDSPDGFYDRTSRGIRCDNDSDNVIQNNTIKTCGRGINMVFSTGNEVVNNRFEDNFEAIHSSGEQIEIKNNDILNSHAYSDAVEDANAGLPTGIHAFVAAQDNVIEGNRVEGTDGRGIRVQGTGHAIRGNSIVDNGLGILVRNSSDHVVGNMEISENEIRDSVFNGIWIQGGTIDNEIRQNIIEENGIGDGEYVYPGVYIGSEAENTIIEENVIADNIAQGIAGFEVIGTVVKDNEINDNGVGGGTYIYSGIYFESVEDTTIQDNTLTENYWRGIFVNGYTDPLDVSGNSITLKDSNYEEIVINP